MYRLSDQANLSVLTSPMEKLGCTGYLDVQADVQAIWKYWLSDQATLSVSISPMPAMEKQGCTGYLTKQPISINITNGKVGMYRLSDQATYQYQHHQWVSRDVQAI